MPLKISVTIFTIEITHCAFCTNFILQKNIICSLVHKAHYQSFSKATLILYWCVSICLTEIRMDDIYKLYSEA